MTQTCSRQHVYHLPWHIVVMAYQGRMQQIPHPKIPSLVAVTFGEFGFDDLKREVRWEVLGHVEPPVPAWVRTLGGIELIIFKTTNTLSYSDKTLIVEVENVNFRKSIQIQERNSFRPHPNNPQHTLYEQNSTLTLRSILGMQVKVEQLILKAYLKNYEAGRQVDQEFAEDLLQQPTLPRRGYLEHMALEAVGMDKHAPFIHDAEAEETLVSGSSMEVEKASESSSGIAKTLGHGLEENYTKVGSKTQSFAPVGSSDSDQMFMFSTQPHASTQSLTLPD